MGSKHFSKAPNISIPRSKFKMPFTHKTSFEFGKLVPIDCMEILPGDTINLNLASFIRMSNPIAPIMDNVRGYIHAYFCPLRLIWEHTEEFYGANKTTAGYQKTIYKIPTRKVDANGISTSSVSHYLGKPVCNATGQTKGFGEVSVLKERGFWMIWSEYYRAQQLQDPFICYTNDWAEIGSIGGSNIYFNEGCPSVCKQFDYFTAATTSPQYGNAVTLPLGTFAPVVAVNDTGSNIDLGTSYFTGVEDTEILKDSSTNIVTMNSSSAGQHLDIKADLSQATSATINSIRYAFAVQKYLERSNFGSRFFEMLNLHYGVTSPDSRLQRPEYLGGTEFLINVTQVLSTAGAETGVSSKLGQPGAVSVTVNKKNLFNKGFVEPGYLYVLLETKQDHTYSQGLLREDTKTDRFEFYSPEFCNLGDQEIKKKEIMYSASGTDEDTFGYQEHWAEYRYRPDRVSGLLDPNASDSLSYWTLADKFATVPSLSAQFITENRENIARALVTGINGPDFIADFFFDYTAIREMPVYTIPGLVDHFGVM